MFNIKTKENIHGILFIITTMLTILTTLYFNIHLGIETVYTHLFYIPILLAGLWYHKKAVYVAIFLGLIHIFSNYSLYHELTYSPLLRAAIFIIIAYATGYIAEIKDDLYKKLKSSREYFKVVYNVMEQSPNNILITDSEGKITYINPKYCQISECSQSEVTGKKAEEVFSQNRLYLGDKFRHQNVSIEYEFQLTLKDGSDHWISSTTFPILDDKGEISHTAIIGSDITGRKNTEIALRVSEEKYRQLITVAQECILTIDSDYYVTFANPYAVKMLGYAAEAITGKSILSFIEPQSRDYFLKIIKKDATREPDGYISLIARDGKPIYASIDISQIKDGSDTEGALILMADITDRIKKQELLNTSLTEKEALIKEIHHRVKNNLQIISSLVNLQSGNVSDKNALSALNETQARIRTMALIHEKMYRSTDLSRINLAEYISNLTKALFSIYNTNQFPVSLNLNLAENVKIDMDTAVPCGLIINELVSNSLKHAFPGGRKGEVTVGLTKNDSRVILTVSDDGVGFPPDLDHRSTETLGMQLVNTLTEQLDGNINIVNENGTMVKIDFPLTG